VSASLRRLLPLYLVVFVGFLGYSLMITVFTPMILHNDNGMLAASSTTGHRTVVLGVLLSLYPLGQFLGSPVMGALSDRFGRRPMLLSSLAATTAWYALIAVALSEQSLALLMVASLGAGLSEANIVIAQGAIADAASEGDRPRLFGYIYMSASLAYVVGPLGGGKLADASLASWFGYSTPYWVVFGLLLVMLGWIAIGFHETRSAREGTEVSYRQAFTNLAGVVTDERLRRLYLVNLLLYLAIFGFFRVYPMYLVDEFGLGVSGVSEFVAFVGVPIVIANLWLVGVLSRRLAPRTMVIGFGFALGLLMATVVLPTATEGMWFTLGPTALVLAICLPACAAMVSLAASAREQGRVLGNNQSLQVGAEAMSGLAGGALAAVVVKLPLLVFAFVAILGSVLLAATGTRTNSAKADA
jgi:DHA1 family tetracycline resistance protein-like MFS transporter